jgi:oligoribonuclease NrnB/cAMP/cGMP phosphodiesterase (DHH superfamily)
MNRIFFHRADFDGKCSGAIARKYFSEKGKPWYLYPFNYDMDIPFEEIDKEKDKLYFLDVTMNPYTKIQDLIDLGYDLTICDHHQTFLDTNIQKQTKGKCSLEKAGCELTWEYFYPDKEMPTFIHLLGRYDIWDNKDQEAWNNFMLPLQYGLRNRDHSIIDNFDLWQKLFDDPYDTSFPTFLDGLIDEGKVLLAYQRNSYKNLFYHYFFNATFEDYPEYRLICLNSPGGNSSLFESKWDENEYDGMFAFAFNGETWNCSIYSTKKDIDFSKIAVGFGGGGHKSACGFQAKEVKLVNGKIKIVTR